MEKFEELKIKSDEFLRKFYNEESERTIARVVEHTLRRRKNLRHSIELEKRCLNRSKSSV